MDVPLDLQQARRALFSALWIRSLGGLLVSSNENALALEDLEWLGIEPDAMTSSPKTEHYTAAADELADDGRAYRCYCTKAEHQEMRSAPPGSPEPVVYDGRCIKLTAVDRKAMKKANRRYTVRLARSTGDAPAAQDSTTGVPPWDFALIDDSGVPTRPFATLVDERTARANHALVDMGAEDLEPTRAAIVARVGWDAAATIKLPPVATPSTPVSELRAQGYLPGVILRILAAAGWKPTDAADVDDMADDFDPAALSPDAPEITLEMLRTANRDALASMPMHQRVQTLSDHLTRRGYAIAERDIAWQTAFVEAITPRLSVLADAEPVAAGVLPHALELDPSIQRVLARPNSQAMLTRFTDLIDSLDDDSLAGWVALVDRFRDAEEAPGRAISVVRMATTGARSGPDLAPLLSLIGLERCRERFRRVRRLAR